MSRVDIILKINPETKSGVHNSVVVNVRAMRVRIFDQQKPTFLFFRKWEKTVTQFSLCFFDKDICCRLLSRDYGNIKSVVNETPHGLIHIVKVKVPINESELKFSICKILLLLRRWSTVALICSIQTWLYLDVDLLKSICSPWSSYFHNTLVFNTVVLLHFLVSNLLFLIIVKMIFTTLN